MCLNLPIMVIGGGGGSGVVLVVHVPIANEK